MRPLLILSVLALSAGPAMADGWTYSSGPTPLLPKGENLQMINNGAAMFMCSPHLPLTFGVEISYDTRDVYKKHPPMKVTWIVDDTTGETSSWQQNGLYVLADNRTSLKIAARAKTAKAVVGIHTGKLTSLFDVKGLARGLGKLTKACS